MNIYISLAYIRLFNLRNLTHYYTLESYIFFFSSNSLKIGSTCKRQNPCGEAYCIDKCDCPGYRCAECEGAYEESYGWYCLNGGKFNVCS